MRSDRHPLWRNLGSVLSDGKIARWLMLGTTTLLAWGSLPYSLTKGDELEALDRLAEARRAIANDDFTEAIRRLTKANAAARKARSAATIREIELTQKWASMMKREWQDLRRAREKLDSNPGDPLAQRKLGEFYCFVKEDWKRGLPFLAKGDDEVLRQVAKLDLQRPSQDATQYQLAKKWLDAADSVRDAKQSRVMRLRARYWLLQAGAQAKQPAARRAINAQLDKITLYPTRIDIWNTHNGTHGDRGTLKCNLILLYKSKKVSAGSLQLPWRPEQNLRYVAILPGKPVDEVRIEITGWPRNGGGLAEVRVFQGQTNLASGCRITSSGAYNSSYLAQNLNDGIDGANEEKTATGYWILPNKTNGWCSLKLTELK